jgi:LmbE family N-acetylglucosaminyl deacetylase
VWEQAHRGDLVTIWTVCAGEPPEGNLSPFAQELHARWEVGQNAPVRRRIEDLASCQRLGASHRYCSSPDCIYRRNPRTNEFMYTSETSLNGDLQPGDFQLIQSLQKEMGQSLESEAVLVCPLGLGNHVDHQLTRHVAEGLERPLWYYADYPYVLNCKAQLEQMEAEGWTSQVFNISQAGLSAWRDSIAAHASQISTFWTDIAEMTQAVAEYMQHDNGIRLWRKTYA